jgi:PKHD-type hydroxylase
MDIKLYGLNTIDKKGINIVENIVNDSSKLKWHDASVRGEDYNIAVMQKVRQCKSCFLDYNKELDNLFGTLVEDFNRNYSGWNYDIHFLEAIQLSHYSEGNFYDWHVDTLAKPIINNDVSYNRKVSATFFLNDPEEYEGGEFDLEVRGPNAEERFDTIKLPKGSIVIFPSDRWHRVRPVTSGVRKSLVLWFQGPSFK